MVVAVICYNSMRSGLFSVKEGSLRRNGKDEGDWLDNCLCVIISRSLKFQKNSAV